MGWGLEWTGGGEGRRAGVRGGGKDTLIVKGGKVTLPRSRRKKCSAHPPLRIDIRAFRD